MSETVDVARLRAVVTAEMEDFRQGMAEVSETQKRVAAEAKATGSAQKLAAQEAAAAQKEAGRDAAAAAREAQDAAKKLEGQLQSTAEAAQRLGRNLTFGITLPVAAAGVAAVKLASDANESFNKLEVVLGSSAREIDAWSRDAIKNLAMTRGEALAAAGTMGNLFATMGTGQAEAARMSREMVQLAADLASFHNLAGGTEAALLKLRSGLVGEAEPLRQLGVLLNESAVQAKAYAMGLAAVGSELTETQKLQARYALIMEQTTAAQGDMARTGDEVANSTRKLRAEVKELGERLGADFLPLAKEVLGTLRELVHGFTELPKPLQSITVHAALAAAALGPLIGGVARLVLTMRQLAALQGVNAALSGLGVGSAAAGAAGGAAAAAGGTAAAGGLGGLAALGAGGAVAGLGTLAGGAAAGAAVLAGGAAGWWIQDRLDLWGDRRAHRAAGATAAWNERQRAHLERMAAARGMQMDASGKLVPLAPGGGSGPGGGSAAAPGEKPGELQKATDAYFAAQLAEAQALVGNAGARKARAEAAALVPVLQEQLQEAVQRAEALRAEAGQSAEGEVRFQQARRRAWELQARIQDLQSRAQQEEQSERDKALQQEQLLQRRLEEAQRDEARRIEEERRARVQVAEAQRRALESRIAAVVAAVPEDQQARALFEESGPLLAERLQQLEQEAAAAGEGTKEYYAAQAEYWSVQRELVERQRRAGQEALGEAKRAADDARRGQEEQQSLVTQLVRLREAQLRNAVGLTDQQRGRLLLPALLQQLQSTLQAVPGEGQADRVRRLTEAEGVKSQMLAAIGATGRGAFVDVPGGRLPTFDVQLFQQLDALVRKLEAEAARAAPQVVVNVVPPALTGEAYGRVFADPAFQAQLHALVAAFMDRDARAALGG